MKTKLVLLSLLVIFSLILGACAPAAEEPEVEEPEVEETEVEEPSQELAVGIVLPTKDEPRWIQDQTRFQNKLAELGYEAEILFSQADPSMEKSNVEALITKGVEVIILCPHDSAAAAASAEAARDAGVTVISYDRLITDTEAVDYYVTFDSVAVGEAQAQYLVDKAEGNWNPLYLYAGAATDNNAFLFFEGAWNVLQPKIVDGTFYIVNSSQAVELQETAELTRDEMGDIISQITTNWDFDDAKSLAEANLTAASADDKGDVFILAPNDGTARAIADAFGADTDVDSFVVTGQDAEIASVQYIIDGKQSMTVLKDVRNLVDDAISVAVSVVEGETVQTTGEYDNGVTMVPAIQSEVITVDRSNVIEAIIESGYWDASEFTGLDQLEEVEEEEEEAGIDLEICGTDEEVTITYVGDPVDTSKAAELATIERFNEYCPNITVNRIDGDPSTTDLLASYFTVFEAESSDLDVIRVDVVNPGVLAEHLLDLNPYTPDAQKASYIPSLLVNNTVDGRLVALPIRLGFGMLYYRTDLLEKYGFDAPPATWDELETMAQTIQDGERAEGNTDFWGYVWQGNAYEGLTCNALEWQVSNGGGQIVNPDGVIEVNNEAAIAAFERAASWVGTISPDAVTSFQESDSNDVWMAGNAAFMRYWPGAYATSQQADAIKDVFATAPLPAGDSGEGASTMGGWEIGVSRYSAYPEAAAAFAVFMTGEENAKYYAIDTTFPPVILDLYNDPDIQAAVPYASPEIVEIVTPRPSTVTAEKYSEVSSLYWTAVHSILTGEQDAATAMELLELDLEALLQE